MFRVKISAAFVILTAVLVGFVYHQLNTVISAEESQHAEVALRRAATIAEQSRRLDEFALLEKAKYVGIHPHLCESMTATYAGNDPVGQRHLKVHEKLVANKFRLQDLGKASKGKRNIDLDLLRRRPQIPDMVMALDASGKGVAALGKDLYSWFGQDVAKQHPIVNKVLKDGKARSDVWLWSWGPGDDAQLYQVAIAPLRTSADTPPVGVVVLGNMINDGVARRSQRLLAGISSRAGNTSATVNRKDLASAPEIAFFRGSHFQGTTFDTGAQKALRNELFNKLHILKSNKPEELLKLKVGKEPYIALVRFFPRQHGNKPAGFAVLSDLKKARKPLMSVENNVLSMGVGILLVGVVLLLYLAYAFMKPLGELEEGIQEIIAGNKDYEFVPIPSHDIQPELAQSLNLMSAYLQGKPMPDDDSDTGGSWGELMPDGNAGAPPKPQGAPKVQGFSMPGMGSKPSPPKED